jgi:hypothetical protein
LDRLVSVTLDGANQQHIAGASSHDRDGHHGARFIVQLCHPNLLAEDSNSHRSSPCPGFCPRGDAANTMTGLPAGLPFIKIYVPLLAKPLRNVQYHCLSLGKHQEQVETTPTLAATKMSQP